MLLKNTKFVYICLFCCFFNWFLREKSHMEKINRKNPKIMFSIAGSLMYSFTVEARNQQRELTGSRKFSSVHLIDSIEVSNNQIYLLLDLGFEKYYHNFPSQSKQIQKLYLTVLGRVLIKYDYSHFICSPPSQTCFSTTVYSKLLSKKLLSSASW